jgi:cation transport regulator ChaB
MSGQEEMPDTIRRSPAKAQRTWVEAHDSAVETYGEGRRAHMVAFAALKHSFEKVGDRWEPKARRGPSDERAASGAGQPSGRTHGGVDVRGHSKEELLERARRTGAKATSRMTKEQLADIVARRQG